MEPSLILTYGLHGSYSFSIHWSMLWRSLSNSTGCHHETTEKSFWKKKKLDYTLKLDIQSRYIRKYKLKFWSIISCKSSVYRKKQTKNIAVAILSEGTVYVLRTIINFYKGEFYIKLSWDDINKKPRDEFHLLQLFLPLEKLLLQRWDLLPGLLLLLSLFDHLISLPLLQYTLELWFILHTPVKDRYRMTEKLDGLSSFGSWQKKKKKMQKHCTSHPLSECV